MGAENEEKKERELGETFVCVEKRVELEHGEMFVDDQIFDEVRAHHGKKEPEHCEILGVEKDEKRAEPAHSEICVMEGVANFAENAMELEHCEIVLGTEQEREHGVFFCWG